MAFDTPTRNRLNSLVGGARELITDELTQQFQSLYGISATGSLTDLGQLSHLDEAGLATASMLRSRIDYLVRSQPESKNGVAIAVSRVAREQAFTVLNRLAAVRMAEKRSLIVESVGGGYKSKGFLVFERVAGAGLGDTYLRYRRYLFCLFDELAVDLGALFDRRSPQGILFPREPALIALLDLLNAPDLDSLWSEDETIGWIYQYYNDQAERKKMREESSAPRNSRELAVRNQFFTPRYVVEFLTDNTLGRIWYEMTQGGTQLKERCRYLVRRPSEIFLKPGEAAPEQPKQDNLSQEDLLKQTVYIPHRPLKDPRTILMLDPACGSMHFGLYAFDLFEVLYDEAWELEQTLSADALSRPPGMKSLHDTYADKQAFLKDVPKLIIEHNIHGIDIDPRAAQIAGLALWLRAQRSWKDMGLAPAQRPAIKRSNIVCAEPMPGEKELLREFVEREFPAAERAVCLRLLEAIFDKMQLAGEAGSLLKIEEEIRSAIEDARDAWQKLATKPPELFTTTELNQLSTAPELTGLEQAVSSLTTDPRHLTTDFWERIEERIYAALRDYAEQAENGGGFQRRLFAEDAARGFAFIDVCRKRYDVVEMNPPFGDSPVLIANYLEHHFCDCGRDIYAAFIARGLDLLHVNCRLGAITSRSGFFLSSMENWRSAMLLSFGQIAGVADLGYGVLDAKVETAAYCITRVSESIHLPTGSAAPSPQLVPFIRVLGLDQKDSLILSAITDLSLGIRQPYLFLSAPADFSRLPGKPFAYSARKEVLHAYANFSPFENGERTIRAGVQSSDDFRFLRCWWEVPCSELLHGINSRDWKEPAFQEFCRELSKSRAWCSFVKGGEYSPFFADVSLVIKWKDDGAEVKAYALTTPGTKHWSRNIRSTDCFFKPGLTYLARTSIRLCATPLPAGCIISNEAGPGIFAPTTDLLWVLGRFNSLTLELLTTISQRRGMEGDDQTKVYGVGALKTLPWPERGDMEVDAIFKDALTKVQMQRATDELSKSFTQLRTIEPDDWTQTASAVWKADQSVSSAYGIDAFECAQETIGFTSANEIAEELRKSLLIGDFGQSASALAATKVLHFVGTAFGRWDIRYATGEQAAPELPDPFAPLPVCPPGQLQNAQGLPARPEDVPAAYPVRIPWDGILVDDPNHPLDIERRVREVIEIIWRGQEGGPTAEAIEHEACEILGVKSLRDYFRKPAGFFADHLKRYSKSRRQAPIYWPLSTASGSYTLWIYYHRLTDQTLHTAIADFIEPKLKTIETEIGALRAQLDGGGPKLAELLDFRGELLDLKAELERVIKLPWKPNLNDGVLITASPLWKLFRLPKWQKDLKACWEELAAGDYDWAHLAYTIWPDRVRQLCEKDRSVAIAHGLEHLCKTEPPKTKKARKAKADTTEPGEELLQGIGDNQAGTESGASPFFTGSRSIPKDPKPAEAVAGAEPESTDRNSVMFLIRLVFGHGGVRDQETALRQLSAALGYQRLGSKVREVLDRDLQTARRRGILSEENGQLQLATITHQTVLQEQVKTEFLAVMSRSWATREETHQFFARFLGFNGTDPALEQTAHSLIECLIQEGRIQTDELKIRPA